MNRTPFVFLSCCLIGTLTANKVFAYDIAAKNADGVNIFNNGEEELEVMYNNQCDANRGTVL